METLKYIGKQLLNTMIIGIGIVWTMFGIHSFNEESGYTDYIRGHQSSFFRIIFMSSYGREVANMRNNYVRFTDDEMENIIRRFNTFTVIGILMIVLMHL